MLDNMPRTLFIYLLPANTAKAIDTSLNLLLTIFIMTENRYCRPICDCFNSITFYEKKYVKRSCLFTRFDSGTNISKNYIIV